MLEILNVFIFATLALGVLVILAALLFSVYLGIMDSDLFRSIRLWRRERLVNKFMEDLKK